MTSKKALIIGVGGQDGCLLAKSLLVKSIEVIGLSRKYPQNSKNLKKLGIENDIDIHQGDITNKDTLLKLIEDIKPD